MTYSFAGKELIGIMFLFFLILIAIGAVNVLAPQFVWRIRYGKLAGENSEPHPSFLTLSRLAGMMALVGATLILTNGL